MAGANVAVDSITDISADAPEAVPGPVLCQVRCITEVKPWATVHDKDGVNSRPLELDEVAAVPKTEGQILQKNRHAIIVG